MIQVYTGDGKGKTTAAIGLALRACQANLKVYIGQFIKGKGYYGEIKALKKLKNIKVEQFGRGCFIGRRAGKTDRDLAQKGLRKIEKIIAQGKFGLVILDEINIALKLKLVKLKDVVGVIKKTPEKTELVLTGRCAPKAILKLADLVSEIKNVKHYYQKGVKARKGIEY